MRFSRVATVCTAVLVGASSLVACTSDDDKSSEPADATSTEPTTSLTRPDAEFAVSVRKMEHVRPADRAKLKAALAAPVQTWFNGAFIEGDYPRNSFTDGMSSWTPDAARLAARDRNTTTNAALGRDVVGVVADQQGAQLYVFANQGVPGGATARVRLTLTEEKSTGDLVRVTVKGRVYLTKDKSDWKIFGYDLNRTEAPA